MKKIIGIALAAMFFVQCSSLPPAMEGNKLAAVDPPVNIIISAITKTKSAVKIIESMDNLIPKYVSIIPEAGNIFLIIAINVENTGKETVQVPWNKLSAMTENGKMTSLWVKLFDGYFDANRVTSKFIAAGQTESFEFLAVATGKNESIDFQYDKKERIRIPLENSKIINAFFAAAANGDAETIRAYIRNGGDVNALGINDETAIKVAAYNGRTEIVKLLIDAKADVNAKDVHDQTALMDAAGNGKYEATKLLIAAKADLNARSTSGLAALTLAKGNGYAEIVKILVEAGAQ